MTRGTTPTLTFPLPVTQGNISELFVTFCQGNRTVLEKKLADAVFDGNDMSVTLTQAETLRFISGTEIEIQIRLKTTDGTAMVSNIMSTDAERILKNGEI